MRTMLKAGMIAVAYGAAFSAPAGSNATPERFTLSCSLHEVIFYDTGSVEESDGKFVYSFELTGDAGRYFDFQSMDWHPVEHVYGNMLVLEKAELRRTIIDRVSGAFDEERLRSTNEPMYSKNGKCSEAPFREPPVADSPGLNPRQDAKRQGLRKQLMSPGHSAPNPSISIRVVPLIYLPLFCGSCAFGADA